MLREPPPAVLVAMLGEVGLPSQFHLSSLPGGANNRVYRVDSGEQSVLLKVYFQHAGDPRDRLGAEYAFSRFAWDQGLRCLPRPLACDRGYQAALYEFIDGRRLAANEVGMAEVQQAIDFYRDLNRHRPEPAAKDLPRGSEACFTLEEHLACVERRFARLEQLDASTPSGAEAVHFVRHELAPVWQRARRQVLDASTAEGLSLDQPISSEDECLSPSDFGFHNAILATDGWLRFLDFEYAGWDDPAKTICDFFCQPAVPVPAECVRQFAEAVVAERSDPEMYLRRVALLLPVYQVKWCCIMLNDFLPVSGQRRAFSLQGVDCEARQQTQLAKARGALEQIRV